MSKYLIATSYDAVAQTSNVHYENYQIITANTPKEACEIYSKKNNCVYCYASAIMEVDDDTDENDVESVLDDIREHLKTFGINPNIV